MLVKPITFTNLDGEEITKKFYFNLSKAELIEMDIYAGGMKEKVEKLVESQDSAGIFTFFKELIEKAVGEKDADGITFRKSKDISERFMMSEAYSVLLTEIMNNEKAATTFIQGILPKDMVDAVDTKSIPMK